MTRHTPIRNTGLNTVQLLVLHALPVCVLLYVHKETPQVLMDIECYVSACPV